MLVQSTPEQKENHSKSSSRVNSWMLPKAHVLTVEPVYLKQQFWEGGRRGFMWERNDDISKLKSFKCYDF